MSKIKRAIGLMSGTSMDGIDLALIETDGGAHVRRLAAGSVSYDAAFRAKLRQALRDAEAITERGQRPGCLADVERELSERHAEATLRFMGDRMLQPSAVDVVGFHGQTVLHRPIGVGGDVTFTDLDLGMPEVRRLRTEARLLTVQLGDGPLLAERTGIDVVYDMRAADCAAGGEGAPMVPVYHQALAEKIEERPVAFVNIGGVANITWIGRDGRLVAFDTGPGNALIDDWMLKHSGAACDVDGGQAAGGKVDGDVVKAFMREPYMTRVPPKSLDRQAFHGIAVGHMSLQDGAATLTAVTAEAIARAREHVPEEPALWVICGGGRRNRTLMGMIAARVTAAVAPAEALGLDGDTMEAEAWAYLAVRSLAGLALTYPGTTGVLEPTPGGVLAQAP
ncbi:MAG: anhydro-N-acetylmuramic acid kinase [Hyphomicrobiaceae bacterium]